jgi:CRP-like cAMP-binding protein
MAIIDVLRTANIFQDLDMEELRTVAEVGRLIECSTGDLIFEEGAASDELYVIASGEVDIQVDPGLYGETSTGGRITITTLRRGQSFGEMALVSEGIRAASARCAQHDSSLLVIPRQSLMALFDQYPRLGYKLMHNLAADLATKIRTTDLLIQERVTWTDLR